MVDRSEAVGKVGEDIHRIVDDVLNPIAEASKRIADQTRNSGDLKYLLPYLKVYGMLPGLFLTDRPDKIFGKNNRLFTITSTLALEKPDGNAVLLPPFIHPDNNIYTHRGIGLALFSVVMQQLGYELGNKDYFVWLAPQVDAEQFVIEDKIARTGKDNDVSIRKVLFDNPGTISKSVQINPFLLKLLTSIIEGNSLYGRDQQITEYTDNLLTVLHKTVGIREGWFNTLEGILKGNFPAKREIDIRELLIRLEAAHRRHSLPVPKSSQVALLEVDTESLVEATPIYPFVPGVRPPSTIVPAPRVPFSAIRRVYLEEPYKLPERYSSLVTSIEKLPHDRWLADANKQRLTPGVVRERGIDPRNSICDVRYNEDPIEIWAKHLREGDMAPLSTLFYDWVLNILHPDEPMDYAILKLVLEQAESMGVFSKINPIFQDQKTREKFIMGQAGMAFESGATKAIRSFW